MQKHILAAQQAPKYALTSTQFGFPLYIADTEKTNGSLIADKIMDADEFAEAALENYQSNADASGTLPLSSDKHEDFVFGAKQAFPL